MFVGVSGLIGVGKSTLTRQLAEELDRRSYEATENLCSNPGPTARWKPYYEPVETNPYLEDFYKNISRWTFNMQMFLLAQRFEQHQEVLWDPCHKLGGGIVQDRTIYEDTIFARMHREDGLMDDRDWATYINHFHIMQGFLRYPDVILYLRADPKVALTRVNERARSAEEGLPLHYLQRLHEGYEEFVEEMQRYTVVLTLDWTNYQPITDVADMVLDAAAREQKFLRSLCRI